MEKQTRSLTASVSATQMWLTEVEAAAHLNMSRKWLQKARLTGGGPRFAKFGAAVRYSMADLEEFERLSLRRSTSDVGGA